jgi:SAM-dependent methyltransferase
MTNGGDDMWSRWLLERRFGNDPQRMKAALGHLRPVRDRVLAHAGLRDEGTLLDVGCGDGLIAFGALERWAGVQVVLTDISQPLLNQAQGIADTLGVRARCRFLQAAADDLSAVAESSVDAVTTRSVLIYVEDKQKAFHEFHRVLRSGGRVSIFEPINRFFDPFSPGQFLGYDVGAVADIAAKVAAVFLRLQPPDRDPMIDFDERDLLACADRAGFREMHLEYEAHVQPPDADWDGLLHVAGNPKIPSLAEAMQEMLTPEEATRFMAHLRPLVEARQGRARSAVAYLWATK